MIDAGFLCRAAPGELYDAGHNSALTRRGGVCGKGINDRVSQILQFHPRHIVLRDRGLSSHCCAAEDVLSRWTGLHENCDIVTKFIYQVSGGNTMRSLAAIGMVGHRSALPTLWAVGITATIGRDPWLDPLAASGAFANCGWRALFDPVFV